MRELCTNVPSIMERFPPRVRLAVLATQDGRHSAICGMSDGNQPDAGSSARELSRDSTARPGIPKSRIARAHPRQCDDPPAHPR